MLSIHAWRVRLPTDTTKTVIEDRPFIDVIKRLLHIDMKWPPFGDLNTCLLNYPKLSPSASSPGWVDKPSGGWGGSSLVGILHGDIKLEASWCFLCRTPHIKIGVQRADGGGW